MNNIVEDIRDGSWIRVDGITSGGNYSGRQVHVSPTGRLIGDRNHKKYVHPANTRPIRGPERKRLIKDLLNAGEIK
tara:strand:+ start:91 stop:318 length:228 start_codon:yes stop_codon:yes gene_type:complete